MSKNRTLSDRVYLSKDIPEEELQRLQVFKYPHELSSQVLGNVKDKKILDVGAGPSLMLGRFVRRSGGKYIPLDVNPKFLELHESYADLVVEGNICDNVVLDKITDLGIDIMHMRFVLMHIAKEMRPKIIRRLIAVVKEKAIFLEYNWQGMSGSQEVMKFKNFTIEHSESFGMDIFYGAKLKHEVLERTTEKVESQIFTRGKGQYYHELIPLVRATKVLLNKVAAPVRSLIEFGSIVASLKYEANLINPPGFVPPSVVCTEVNKNVKKNY